jgi:hypothetical protein
MPKSIVLTINIECQNAELMKDKTDFKISRKEIIGPQPYIK